MTDTPHRSARLVKIGMWLVLLLSTATYALQLLPFPAALIGSSFYLLVGRRHGFINQKQPVFFGRPDLVFAAFLVVASAVGWFTR